MGERVEAGVLVYNVFEADWTPKLGSGQDARTPLHRFLVIHLSVTNSSAEPVSMPSLTLVDEAGQSFGEEVTEADVPAQLGLIRTIKPAETLHGRILFDVEPKSYKLKLDDGSGKTALVDMPLRFSAEQPAVPSSN